VQPEERYFGLRGAYYPVKVAILQGLTVMVQAFGKISLLGASSPLPKKSRTRLPFFGLVLASGLSLLCCVGTVSIPPFFLCSLTLPGLELEQHLRMLLWTLATS